MTQRAAIQKLYSIDEFIEMPEFSEGYELLDGRVVKKPMPFADHVAIADAIQNAMYIYDPKRKLGRAQCEASIDIGIPRNAPIPDVSYWKGDRFKARAELAPLPDLAVEVLSYSDTKSPSDLKSAMVKVHKLIDAGVPIVWVVNSHLKTIDVYHARQRQAITHLGQNDKLSGEDVIPGFEIEIKDLFE